MWAELHDKLEAVAVVSYSLEQPSGQWRNAIIGGPGVGAKLSYECKKFF